VSDGRRSRPPADFLDARFLLENCVSDREDLPCNRLVDYLLARQSRGGDRWVIYGTGRRVDDHEAARGSAVGQRDGSPISGRGLVPPATDDEVERCVMLLIPRNPGHEIRGERGGSLMDETPNGPTDRAAAAAFVILGAGRLYRQSSPVQVRVRHRGSLRGVKKPATNRGMDAVLSAHPRTYHTNADEEAREIEPRELLFQPLTPVRVLHAKDKAVLPFVDVRRHHAFADGGGEE